MERQATRPALIDRHPWIPLALPFGVFIALTALQGVVPGGVLVVYPVKTLVVALILFRVRHWLPPLRPSRVVLPVAVGIVVFLLWILPEGHYPLLGTPVIFDPTAHLSGPALVGWVAVRLLGAALLVPVMEEVFWRGFLLRWIIAPDFERVAIGAFTWGSFLIVTVLFASEHWRWLPGLVAGATYNLLLYRTRRLGDCVTAHAVTNLALGVYVLATGHWAFW